MKRQASNENASRSRKKQKNIKRPLSAYNIYFKLVRPVLIETHERGEKQPDFDTHLENAIKAGKSKAQGALFQAASRTLAERWKDMSPIERQPFEKQAQEENKKYKIQLSAMEMQRTNEDRSKGAKAKEAPKAAPAADLGEGASSAATSTKGERPQQSNLSDSEATTISSKSEPVGNQGKIFVQQSSGVFNNKGNTSSGESGSQYPSSVPNDTPNVVGASDSDSVKKSNNQSFNSDMVSRAIASILMDQFSGTNNGNNGLAEEIIRRLVATAVLEALLAEPAALLLLMILLLQGSQVNQAAPINLNPQNNHVASLLVSMLANNMAQNTQHVEGVSSQQQQPSQHTFSSPPAPGSPAFIQENGQSNLIEKLSQLSAGEMEILKKLVENRAFEQQNQTSH